MKTSFNFFRKALLGTALLAGVLAAQAQNTIWTNAAGGDWNTAVNWNPNQVPGTTTNVFMTNLYPAYTVTYSLPMSALNIASLSITNTNSAILNINAAGFAVAGNISARAGSRVTVGNGGVVTSGSATLTGSGNWTVASGGIFTNNGVLGIGNSSPGSGAVTNNGGVLVTASVTIGAAADGGPLVINGGTNLLGSLSIGRCGGAASTLPSQGSGVVINNGLVNFSSMVLGAANSWGNLTVNGGVVTNTGDFILGRQTSANRGGRVTQNGGLLVSTTNAGVRMCLTTAGQIAAYAVYGGTNVAEGFVLGDASTTTGTVNFTNAGTMVIGSLGLVSSNAGTTVNLTLNNGGNFYAKANWTSSVPMQLASSSTFTFNAGDLDGTPYNVNLSGVVRGSGTLAKAGAGTLQLDAVNTYSGNTLINAGTLKVGASGSLASSFQVVVGSGSTLDVSAATGFTVASGKSLTGFGAIVGDVAVAANGSLNPGTNTVTGTLSFSNSLTQTGGAINHFDLSTNPSGPANDLIIVAGDLNISGVSNIVEIVGGGVGGSVHPLIKYYGNFNGDFASLIPSGTTGYLTNDTSGSPKIIAFVVSSSVRSATNVVWQGNDVNNVWDVLNTTNWLNNGALDYFVNGDTAAFTDVGLANSNVLINVAVTPSSTVVNSTGDYSFSGSGAIGGLGGLTKTNSGTLTISTVNSYTGPTIISGGKLIVATLANGGVAGPIGAAIADPNNFVINGGTLEYQGNNLTTDRGLTLGATGATIAVTNATKVLTLSGTLTGAGALTKTGNGQITLTGVNNYQGGTVITAGIVRANPVSGLGTNAVTLTSTEFSPSTFQFAGDSQTLSAPINIIGTNNFIANGGNDTIGRVVGSGTVYLNGSAGNILTMQAVDSTAFTGTFYLNTLPTVRIFPSTGNTLNASNATFNLGLGAGVLNNRDGGSFNLGALEGGPSTTVRGSANSGSAITTYTIGGKNVDSTFAGVISTGAGGAGARVNIVKVGTGKLMFTGANTYNGFTAVNSGVLALGDGVTDGSISSTTNLNIAAGAFVDVSGRSDGTLSLSAAQTLTGNGTINGSVGGTGTISPGNGIGTLTVTNVATLGGTLYVELNRTNGVQTNDVLAASSIVLGGTLTVTNLGPNLVAGDRFVLFSGPISGSFGTVNLPGNLGNVTYTWTDNTAVDGSIQVATVTTVNQTPTNLVASVSGSTLTLSWPADHTGWRLQAQTNSLSTGLTSVWADVTGSSTTNAVTIDLDPANGAVFYRMVYP